MRKIFHFLGALCLIGLVSAPASAQYLSEDELTRLMAGTSIETTSGKDWPFFMKFNADGSLDGRIEANRERLDDGKWWTEESRVGARLHRPPRRPVSAVWV